MILKLIKLGRANTDVGLEFLSLLRLDLDRDLVTSVQPIMGRVLARCRELVSVRDAGATLVRPLSASKNQMFPQSSFSKQVNLRSLGICTHCTYRNVLADCFH